MGIIVCKNENNRGIETHRQAASEEARRTEHQNQDPTFG